MQLHHLRNATMRLTYAGRTILTDPYLGAKHAYTTLAGREANPTVVLPCTPQEAVAGIDMALISHLHNDHFDPVGQQVLPKHTPIFTQPESEERIRAMGFQQVTSIADKTTWEGIVITRTAGTHGTGTWGEQLNPVCGFILRAANEPTVYWCGDTIWYGPVERVIRDIRPDVIITHSAGAELEDSGPIVMDAVQTIAICRAAPWSRVVAIHLDALDHCLVSRAMLGAYAETEGISPSQLIIPADGERLTL